VHTEVIAVEEFHHYAANLIEDSEALLIGRVTYKLFERYWPSTAKTGAGTGAEIEIVRIHVTASASTYSPGHSASSTGRTLS
jgi:dihydrofolate reductase